MKIDNIERLARKLALAYEILEDISDYGENGYKPYKNNPAQAYVWINDEEHEFILIDDNNRWHRKTAIDLEAYGKNGWGSRKEDHTEFILKSDAAKQLYNQIIKGFKKNDRQS